MLANHGLGFLLNHCGTLKHAMEAVTGDSGTVTHAAQTWGDIAEDLKELAHSTQETVGSGLKDWGGQGAQLPASSSPSWSPLSKASATRRPTCSSCWPRARR